MALVLQCGGTAALGLAIGRENGNFETTIGSGLRVAASAFMIFIILVVLLVLALGGSAPVWGHSRNWGYAPSGGFGTVLLIVLCIWFFSGRV